MSENSENLFSNQIVKIYKELEKSLTALAYRYRTPRPQGAVKEWLSRAYEIALKFDRRELTPKVKIDGDLVEYDPAVHTEDQFVSEMKNYLKRCFTNDLLRAYNYDKKMVSDNDGAQASLPTRFASGTTQGAASAWNCTPHESYGQVFTERPCFKYDAIRLDSLLKIFSEDLMKSDSSQGGTVDVIHGNFIRALVVFVKQLLENDCWREIVVVPDLDENDNRRFFSNDLRSELESGIRKELCKQLIEEENPLIIEKLMKLVDPENKATLQKRIFRYLFGFKGGIPKRLRQRVKNRTL
jgi:hypothetical protein